jgi:NADP-dependent 3-hydroxy acid dehydrogenase YdfG
LFRTLKNQGAEVTFYELDVTKEEQVKEVIDKTVAKFDKLDSIINNSGISLGNAILGETESDELKQMPDTDN